MDYTYKPTTHGRAVMAACMDLEKPLKIVRVAFGSGKVAEDTNLADVHELLEYVSDGAVAERRHEEDRFFLTVQYANKAHPDVKMFMLSEFIVYVEDPETGGETDLLYGTLGDYRQPVPAYNPAFPPSVFNFPLELVISDEINVTVSAPAGLVTHDELEEAVQRHSGDLTAHPDIRQAVEDLQDRLGGGVVRAERIDLTIPAEGWEPDDETGGVYAYRRDIAHAKVEEDMVPMLSVLPTFISVANACALCTTASTLSGSLRVYAKSIPTGDISVNVVLLGDVHSNEEITIPAVGWVEDEDTSGLFPVHIDIASEAITPDLIPMITILPESLKASGDCGLCPATQTLDGTLRFYAKEAPSEPIHTRLTLLDTTAGASSSTSPSHMIPAADGHTLGGVMVKPGSGLSIDARGNLSLDAASGEDVAELFNGSKASSGQE